MKKKVNKKLVFNRETVANLGVGDMNDIAGGVSGGWSECPGQCNTDGLTYCCPDDTINPVKCDGTGECPTIP